MSLHYFALLVSFFRKPHPSSFSPRTQDLMMLPYLSDLSFSVSFLLNLHLVWKMGWKIQVVYLEAILEGANKDMGKVKENRKQANKRCIGIGQVGAVITVSLGWSLWDTCQNRSTKDRKLNSFFGFLKFLAPVEWFLLAESQLSWHTRGPQTMRLRGKKSAQQEDKPDVGGQGRGSTKLLRFFLWALLSLPFLFKCWFPSVLSLCYWRCMGSGC